VSFFPREKILQGFLGFSFGLAGHPFSFRDPDLPETIPVDFALLVLGIRGRGLGGVTEGDNAEDPQFRRGAQDFSNRFFLVSLDAAPHRPQA